MPKLCSSPCNVYNILFIFFFIIIFFLPHPHHSFTTASNKAVSSACSSTPYPLTCVNAIFSYSIPSHNISLLQLALLGSIAAHTNVDQALHLAKQLSQSQHGSRLEHAALLDCLQLLDDSSYHLNNTIFYLSNLANAIPRILITSEQIEDLQIWISTALTFQDTCSDGFSNTTGNITTQMQAKQEQVSQVIINAFSLLLNLGNSSSSSNSHYRRRLLNYDFPRWLSSSHRRLLQDESSPSVEYDVVVAADGSGDYITIQDAVDDIPSDYGERYVIYITEGIYNEIVTISKNLKNIRFIGDGINQTIITNNRSVGSGLYTTFDSATVAISGQGFMARDITFQNTAGPSGQQAVAVRAGADYLFFHRCSFEGYQDTLYALSSRQFYRDCQIYGTVDFIFGNAAAVFQSCELLARQPLEEQKNTFTAQGRKIKEDPTGFSFQNCTLSAAEDLIESKHDVQTFLGRPWKAYSRTVFIYSYLDSLIHPAGWLAWNSSDPFEKTLYYGEYENEGPGAGTKQRVPWSGVHAQMSYEEARMFSVEAFISGTTWLSDEDVGGDERIRN